MKAEDRSSIDEAVRVLKKGGVVVFPTDTVWGIGASVASTEGISKLYKIKKRERGKPTAVLVHDLGVAKQLGEFSEEALILAKKHWPGGLTIIVKAQKGMITSAIFGRGASVGLRVPDNDVVLEILRKLGAGVVAGSANFSGGVAPRRFGEIDRELLEKVDYVASEEGWEAGGEEPSTVVDTIKKPFVVLRKGPVEIG
jgi:L-threonylcarbamoyladenylate synthase